MTSPTRLFHEIKKMAAAREILPELAKWSGREISLVEGASEQIQPLVYLARSGELSSMGCSLKTLKGYFTVIGCKIKKALTLHPETENRENIKEVSRAIKSALAYLSSDEEAKPTAIETHYSKEAIALVNTEKSLDDNLWAKGDICIDGYALDFRQEIKDTLTDSMLEEVLKQNRDRRVQMVRFFSLSTFPSLSNRAPGLLVQYLPNINHDSFRCLASEARFLDHALFVEDLATGLKLEIKVNKGFLSERCAFFKNHFKSLEEGKSESTISVENVFLVDKFFEYLIGLRQVEPLDNLKDLFDLYAVADYFQCPTITSSCSDKIIARTLARRYWDIEDCTLTLKFLDKHQQSGPFRNKGKEVEEFLFKQLFEFISKRAYDEISELQISLSSDQEKELFFHFADKELLKLKEASVPLPPDLAARFALDEYIDICTVGRPPFPKNVKQLLKTLESVNRKDPLVPFLLGKLYVDSWKGGLPIGKDIAEHYFKEALEMDPKFERAQKKLDTLNPPPALIPTGTFDRATIRQLNPSDFPHLTQQ